jgi:hypothetical protein
MNAPSSKPKAAFFAGKGLYLAASLLFILLSLVVKLSSRVPSSLELPLAAAGLTPAAFLVWALVGQVRRADELERRILLEALAIAFVVEFTVAIVYAFLEGLGVARPPSILWASLLVISWSVGLVLRATHYEHA